MELEVCNNIRLEIYLQTPPQRKKLEKVHDNKGEIDCIVYSNQWEAAEVGKGH